MIFVHPLRWFICVLLLGRESFHFVLCFALFHMLGLIYGWHSFIITLWQCSELGKIHSSSHYCGIWNLVQSNTCLACFLNELFNCVGHFLDQSFIMICNILCTLPEITSSFSSDIKSGPLLGVFFRWKISVMAIFYEMTGKKKSVSKVFLHMNVARILY